MLSKIHHVGIVVRSADAALAFYRDALGLPVSVDRVIEDQGVRGVLLPIGDAELELLEPTREDTGVARYLETRGEGMHHVCLESDDCAADLAAAAAAVGPSAAALAQRIDHIGIVVEDIAAAAATYQRHFGFSLDDSRGGPIAPLGIENAFMPAGNTDFEFIKPISSEGPVAKFADERGEGSFLLSLAVADASATVEALRANDIRVGDANGGVAFVSPRSSFGVNLQLTQRN